MECTDIVYSIFLLDKMHKILLFYTISVIHINAKCQKILS